MHFCGANFGKLHHRYYLCTTKQIISDMVRISIINRTTKKEGRISLRFRLRDGRNVDLYHKSEIEADLSDLSKFESDGTPKKRANFNRALESAIKERMALMHSVYEEAVKTGLSLTNETFEKVIGKGIHPGSEDGEEELPERTLLNRFCRMVDGDEIITKDGKPISQSRRAHYQVFGRIMGRFLKVVGRMDIACDEVDKEFILSFRDFIINEYKFAEDKRWSYLYTGLKRNMVPTKPRGQNTVSMMMKMFQAFFKMLDANDEIPKNPFNKFTGANHAALLRQEYSKPIALTLEELRRILLADVPAGLQETQEAFLLQCALGCRISDFKKMGMEQISVAKSGVPYIMYVSQKTGMPTRTPIVRFAFDIIKKTAFNFPVLKYVSGKSGFNKKIKTLLKECGIDREVETGAEEGKLVTSPLYELASTKLGRKTNVTLLSRVQINTTIAGLHADGSEAVSHYYDKSLEDLFQIMSRAFGEQPFKVNDNLEIID